MSYVTKDSGKRAAFSNGGVRDTNEGKLRMDLIMPKNVPFEDQLVVRWAELMARGAEKYSDRNWEQFADEAARDRAKESALRHFMQWYFGFKDEDHGAAVLFNIGAADYVDGVLEGKWEAAKTEPTEEESAPLWTGTLADPEPPDHVVMLRANNTGDEYFLFRALDGRWIWGKSWSHEYRPAQGAFRWETPAFSYEFTEVRRG